MGYASMFGWYKGYQEVSQEKISQAIVPSLGKNQDINQG
jgi:hypothetical protein